MNHSLNLAFSHFGISVRDLSKMVDFYQNVLGFTITDQGHVAGMDAVFLSRDPKEHHQIVLATGRPEVMPANEFNPGFGPSINQISFEMGTLADLRDCYKCLLDAGVEEEKMLLGDHGIAWSIYAPDPEGNTLEFFVDSEWYIAQPQLEPLDFSKTDEEIYEGTRLRCTSDPSYEPMEQWQSKFAKKMPGFRPSTSPLV